MCAGGAVRGGEAEGCFRSPKASVAAASEVGPVRELLVRAFDQITFVLA